MSREMDRTNTGFCSDPLLIAFRFPRLAKTKLFSLFQRPLLEGIMSGLLSRRN
jgi:hypothetical protein